MTLTIKGRWVRLVLWAAHALCGEEGALGPDLGYALALACRGRNPRISGMVLRRGERAALLKALKTARTEGMGQVLIWMGGPVSEDLEATEVLMAKLTAAVGGLPGRLWQGGDRGGWAVLLSVEDVVYL